MSPKTDQVRSWNFTGRGADFPVDRTLDKVSSQLIGVERRTKAGVNIAARARLDPIRVTMYRTILIANSIRPYLRRADTTLRNRRGAARLRPFVAHRDTLSKRIPHCGKHRVQGTSGERTMPRTRYKAQLGNLISGNLRNASFVAPGSSISCFFWLKTRLLNGTAIRCPPTPRNPPTCSTAKS